MDERFNLLEDLPDEDVEWRCLTKGGLNHSQEVVPVSCAVAACNGSIECAELVDLIAERVCIHGVGKVLGHNAARYATHSQKKQDFECTLRMHNSRWQCMAAAHT